MFLLNYFQNIHLFNIRFFNTFKPLENCYLQPDSENKRNILGHLFVNLFNAEVKYRDNEPVRSIDFSFGEISGFAYYFVIEENPLPPRGVLTIKLVYKDRMAILYGDSPKQLKREVYQTIQQLKLGKGYSVNFPNDLYEEN